MFSHFMNILLRHKIFFSNYQKTLRCLPTVSIPTVPSLQLPKKTHSSILLYRTPHPPLPYLLSQLLEEDLGAHVLALGRRFEVRRDRLRQRLHLEWGEGVIDWMEYRILTSRYSIRYSSCRIWNHYWILKLPHHLWQLFTFSHLHSFTLPWRTHNLIFRTRFRVVAHISLPYPTPPTIPLLNVPYLLPRRRAHSCCEDVHIDPSRGRVGRRLLEGVLVERVRRLHVRRQHLN